MVKVTGGEPRVEGEPNKLEEESEYGLEGGLTRILRGGVSIPTGNWGWRPRSLQDKCLGGTMVMKQTWHKGKRDWKGKGGVGSTDYNVETRAKRCKIIDFNVLEPLLGGINQALFLLGCVFKVCKLKFLNPNICREKEKVCCITVNKPAYNSIWNWNNRK